MFFFALEFSFVLFMILSLKLWIFPFFIHMWFLSHLSNLMMEWTLLMVGTVTLFLYVGLGSSSRYQYHLSLGKTWLVFGLVHLPLLFLGYEWMSLLGDLYALLLPKQLFSYVWVVISYPILFGLGRWLLVTR